MHFTRVAVMNQRFRPLILLRVRDLLWSAFNAFPDIAVFFSRRLIVFVLTRFEASCSISWVRFLEACFGFFQGVLVAYMSDYRHKRHNVSSLLYPRVCPAKYRRVIFDAAVDTVLKDVCVDIAKRYELVFLEIGTDKDPVHFLVQSVPSYRPTKIVQIIKSLTAREILHRVPTVKKRLGGASFGPKGLSSVQEDGMGMKKSFATMYGSQAWKKAMRNCIAKTSSWGCSKGHTQAIRKPDTPLPAKLAGHGCPPAGV
jgi:putative transposase